MTAVLADERLYAFTGGRPPGSELLRARYRALAAGSGRPDEEWLNWIARERASGAAAGTMQATIVPARTVVAAAACDGRAAYVAWVIGVPWQGRGFATEAARALTGWLAADGVRVILACIYPGHLASEQVASRAGLEVSGHVEDGERVWVLRPGGSGGPGARA
jgi:RimJ/RimL family protein N-acetyltransferase